MSTIGRNLPRNDGYAKVTGRALYVDDIRPEGCLYGATVRSERAHARLVSVEPDRDFDWTDVTIVTADDIPGENVIHLMTDDQPALADGIVRHVTEPVALVAAPTRDRAVEAARHVRITYEDLPPLFDMEVSAGSDQELFADVGFGTNVFKAIDIHKLPHLGPVSEEGLHITEGTYRTGLNEQLYIEPQGMIAIPRDDGGFTIIGSLQCPYYVLKALRRLLGLGADPEDPDPDDRVNVVQAVTGGGFGGKEEFPSLVASHALLLARKAGRPVKLIYRRDEDLRATTKRHPARVRIRSAVTPEGQLRRWEADIIVDGGAYNTLTPVVLSRAVLHATGPYRCDEVHLQGKAVATHTPPRGAFRGFGAPQAMFAVERHMDRIARELGLDPVDLRRRNLYKEGDRTATGQVLRVPGAQAVFDTALEAAAAPLPPLTRPPGTGVSRLRRGRGMAVVFHGCGFTGNGEAWLKGRVALELHGGRVHVLSGSTDIGQGSETTFAQIAAEELHAPFERVVVDPHDTSRVPDSGPTVASRTCMVVGGVVQRAARRLREALMVEVGRSSGTFDELIAHRRSDTVLRVEVVYEDDGSMEWDDATYTGDAYPTYGWAAAVVDLDVDVDTGEVVHRRFVSATDVGRAINPVIVKGQIEGGSLQALGWATSEEVVLDERQNMRNDRITNYIVPTTADAPEMITRIVEIPFSGGPFGAKGLGEIPMDGPAAAVAQAIEQATGVVLDALPMTPERVLAGLQRTH